MNWTFLLSILLLTPTSQASQNENFNMLWVPINHRPPMIKLMRAQFEPFALQITHAPVNPEQHPNPFGVSTFDWNVGHHLPKEGEEPGPAPDINYFQDASWYLGLVLQNKLPDIFLIGGHFANSLGWMSPNEKVFLYAETLSEMPKRHPAAKLVFDHVKLAILGGCHSMTNLQPHGPHGEYLSPAEIFEKYTYGSDQIKSQLIGTGGDEWTLKGYRNRLYDDEHDFTLFANREDCKDPEGPNLCKRAYLNRVFPTRSLWDPEEPFNGPRRWKKLFPNAYLVLGYSTGSPPEEIREEILKLAIKNTEIQLNKTGSSRVNEYSHHIIQTIVSDHTPDPVRREVITEFRIQWTKATAALNGGRASGSITPAYPDLDANGVFSIPVAGRTLTYYPYEKR